MQGALETPNTLKTSIQNLLSAKIFTKEFFVFNKAALPGDAAAAKKKIENNVDRFRFHYLAITGLVFLFYILYHPILLILVALCSACAYLYNRKPTVFNFKIESRVVVVGGALGVFLFFIIFKEFLVGLLAMASMSILIVLSHALLVSDDLSGEAEIV
jgi:PRA1 family protein 1